MSYCKPNKQTTLKSINLVTSYMYFLYYLNQGEKLIQNQLMCHLASKSKLSFSEIAQAITSVSDSEFFENITMIPGLDLKTYIINCL